MDQIIEDQWETFSLTTVIYPKGDLYGKWLALCSLLPFAIIIAFFTLTIFVRDIHVILFFIGQLVNETLNYVLKKYAKEDRPMQPWRDRLCGRSYGWPSSHCQFMTFFAFYSSFCLMFRLKHIKPKWFCLVLFLLDIVSVAFVFHSRTYLQYHYLHQCIHGAMIGTFFAVIWYILVQYLFEPFLLRFVMDSKFNQRLFQLCSIYIPKHRPKSD